MKITKKFLETLNQLKLVNDHLILEKGDTVEIRDSAKMITLKANLDISIPQDASIVSVSGLLSIISLFDLENLDVEFTENADKSGGWITLKDGSSTSKLKLTKAEFLKDSVKPATEWNTLVDKILGEPVLDVTITGDMFTAMRKALDVTASQHMQIISEDNGTVKFVCTDYQQNAETNSFSIKITEEDGLPDFSYTFKRETIQKIIPATYNLKVYEDVAAITLENEDFSFCIPTVTNLTKKIDS